MHLLELAIKIDLNLKAALHHTPRQQLTTCKHTTVYGMLPLAQTSLLRLSIMSQTIYTYATNCRQYKCNMYLHFKSRIQ
jgi:hypothetical protein